ASQTANNLKIGSRCFCISHSCQSPEPNDPDLNCERVSYSLPFLVVARLSATAAIGKRKVKRLPCPGLLSTLTLPPCAATICLTTLNPRPVPWIRAATTSLPR